MVNNDKLSTTPNTRSHKMARGKHAYNVIAVAIYITGDDWASTQRTLGTHTQSPTGKPFGDNDLRMSTSHRHQGDQQVTSQP